MARARDKLSSVFDVARERALAAVQVDRRYTIAQAQQRHGYVHRRGGFSGAPLLIAEHNDMGVFRLRRCASRRNGFAQFRCHRHHPIRPQYRIATPVTF